MASEANDRILGANWTARIVKASDHDQTSVALEIGAHNWIGEAVWIDNLGKVQIVPKVSNTRDTDLGIGNQDWTNPSLNLMLAEFTIAEQC